MKYKGFTLIELLIVVAIIAILAAIAVPNFLEAQMRAKVSRCVSDMRSIATGLESYKIDIGKYPSDAGDGQNGIYRAYRQRDSHSTPKANFTLGFEITTPIAYFSSTKGLIDPFKTGKLSYYEPDSNSRSGRQYYFFFNIPLRREMLNNPNAYNSTTYPYTGDWALWAAGPDGWGNNIQGGGEYSNANQVPRGIPYDATNGTVSNGDIHRTQKGDSIRLRTDVPAGA